MTATKFFTSANTEVSPEEATSMACCCLRAWPVVVMEPFATLNSPAITMRLMKMASMAVMRAMPRSSAEAVPGPVLRPVLARAGTGRLGIQCRVRLWPVMAEPRGNERLNTSLWSC